MSSHVISRIFVIGGTGAQGLPAGYYADPADKSTMGFRDNFTGF